MNIKMPEMALEPEEVEKELESLYESPEIQALLQSAEARDIEELLETHRDWETLQEECQGKSETVEKFLRDSTLTEAKQTITRNILLLRNPITANAQILSRLTRDTQAAFRDLQDDKSIAIIPWSDIPNTPRKWLIPNWLPADTVTMLTGHGGTGKSWLTLQMLCQIACGYQDAFLNPTFKTPSDANEEINPKHIIFATYEDEPEEIKRRLGTLQDNMKWIQEGLPTIMNHIHIVDLRGVGPLWGPGTGEHIANTGQMLLAGYEVQERCEEKDARLLVIDPLSGAFGNSENDRAIVYDFVSAFRKWGDTQGCAVLMIGHLPKGKQEVSFSGSTAWEASARSMMMLGKKEDGESEYYALSHTKNNYAQRQDDIYLRRNRYGWWQKVDALEDAIESYQEYINQNENTQEDTDDDDLYTNPIRS